MVLLLGIFCTTATTCYKMDSLLTVCLVVVVSAMNSFVREQFSQQKHFFQNYVVIKHTYLIESINIIIIIDIDYRYQYQVGYSAQH